MWRFLLILLLLLKVPALAAPRQLLDAEFHHVRNVDPREWSRFSETADVDRLQHRYLQAPSRFILVEVPVG